MRTLLVLILVAFGMVNGQERYRCDCGLFTPQQIAEDEIPSPLAFSVAFDVDPYTCALDEGILHPCALACNDYARNETADNLGLCFETGDNSNRCYGGLMCEIMYADGHTSVEDEPLLMYYRVPECAENHQDWTPSGFRMGEDLCCTDGIYEPCYGLACACYRYSYSYCECGLFVEEMFEVLDGEKVPLPLKMIGVNSTDQPQNEDFCDSVNTPRDTCRALCSSEGEEVFNTYRLNDFPEGSEQTYGEIYCKSIYARCEEYGHEHMHEVASPLGIWERVPRCDMTEWYELDTKDQERLCCDKDGNNVYPCPLDFPNLTEEEIMF